MSITKSSVRLPKEHDGDPLILWTLFKGVEGPKVKVSKHFKPYPTETPVRSQL